MRRALVVFLTAMALQGVGGDAVAQPRLELQDSLARELKASGDEAMGELRYADALAAYERATKIEPHPVLLFNRGRALQALDRFPEALELLEAFSREAPAELIAQAGPLQVVIEGLRKQVATVTVLCSVRGATVLVRGKKVGVTPLGKPVRVNAGAATVTVLADGYHQFRKAFELGGQKTRRIAVRLKRKVTKGVLRVSSPVTGATVRVDGKLLGKAPAELEVKPGTHRVNVTHPDYESAETTVQVEAGRTRTLDVPLEETPGVLSQWWFWTSAAALVVAGVTIAVVATTEKDPTAGDIPPGVISPATFAF